MSIVGESETIQRGADVFQARFDAAIGQLRSLTRTAPPVLGRQLRDVADELVRLRRDLAGIDLRALAGGIRGSRTTDPDDLAPHGARGRAPGTRAAVRAANRARWEGKNRIRAGRQERRCPRHDDGAGAWLPVESFDPKGNSGQLKPWCRACTLRYQRERYVRVGYKVVTIEVAQGDACVGHPCPRCGRPFQVGDRVQGDDLHHEGCEP